jgi:hypothetical protein
VSTLDSIRARDRGLARTASWTRRIAVLATVGCAALAAAFAHVLPGHVAAQFGISGDGTTKSAPPGHHHGNSPAQPPGSGSGAGQATTGAS